MALSCLLGIALSALALLDRCHGQVFVTLKNDKLFQMPTLNNTKPLIVWFDMWYEEVANLNLHDQSYRIDVVFDIGYEIDGWHCIESLKKIQGLKYHFNQEVSLTGKNLDKIFWIPEIYSPQQRADLTGIRGAVEIMTVRVNQTYCHCQYQVQRQFVIGCFMDFHDWPFDMQYCPFQIRSKYYNTEEMEIRWVPYNNKAHLINDHLMIPNERVRKELGYELLAYCKEYELIDPNGVKYKYIESMLSFERYIQFFAMQAWYPSVLLVHIAYCACYIPVVSGPGRFLLMVITFGGEVGHYHLFKGNIPQCSYTTAGDIWGMVCIGFHYGVVVQLTIAFFTKYWRLHQMASIDKWRKRQAAERAMYGHTTALSQFKEPLMAGWFVKGHEDTAAEIYPGLRAEEVTPNRSHLVDFSWRIGYPTAFAMFNTIYWPLLMCRHFETA